MKDCLIIGHNDGNFEDLVMTLRSMGKDHPDFRDLNINYIEYNNKSFRALDILDYFYYEDGSEEYRRFHNSDLLWNVVMYLGTYLNKRGLSFDYINLFQLEKEKLREKLENNDYMTIAITTTVYTMVDPILEVVSFIKKYNKTSKIIVGGPFIAKQVEKDENDSLQVLFRLIGADFFLLCREGEQALSNILHTLKNSGDFSKVKNIAYKNGLKYEMTEIQEENNLLEENMIDYSLFKDDIGDSVNIRISKGCPYACAYCGFPLRAEKFRFLNVKTITGELDQINDIGTVTNLFFMDDSVNVPKARFKELMKVMAERDYSFNWNCFLRCDLCDEEVIQLMKEAKCEGVFLGLESANEQLLKNMNKTSRKEHFQKTIPLFKKEGMVVFTSVFTGFPGETYETFWETIDFIKDKGTDFYRPQLWYCDPITPIWQQREKFGLKGINFAWSHNTMDVKTACDLNEWVFLYLDDPVWAPDPGFNFISVFYLKHRGMTIEQVKTFLRCFNAIVKEKLVYPNKKEVSPYLVDSLRKASQFNRYENIDMTYVNLYSGKEYEKTEKFLLDNFYKDSEAKEIGRFRYCALTNAEKVSKNESKTWGFDKSLIESLEEKYNKDFKFIFFKAACIIMSKINCSSDLKAIMGIDNSYMLPLRLDIPENINDKYFTDSIKQKAEITLPYQIFALHILVNSKEYNEEKLKFDFAFLYSDCEKIEYFENYHTRIYNNLDLVINVCNFNGKVSFKIDSSTDKYSKDFSKQFFNNMNVLLEKLSRDIDIDTDTDIEDISSVSKNTNINLIDGLFSKEFNF